MPNQHAQRTPKRPKLKRTARVKRLSEQLAEAHESIAHLAQKLADARCIIRRLTE